MAMHGSQPSAPPFQNYRARWQQHPSLPTENVPPLFDYELYRAHRGSSFNRGPPSARSNAGAIDPGCGMGLSSIMKFAGYENPDDKVEMQQQHQYSSSTHFASHSAPWAQRPSVRAAVGPPAYMAGGGFESNYQKARKNEPVAATGGWSAGWNFLSPPKAEARKIPVRQSEEQKYVPWISLVIAIAYTVIFIIIMQQNDCPSNPRKACMFSSLRRFSFQPFGENPLLGPSAKTLVRMGALESDLVTTAHEGWRLLTAIWLHAGVLHIMGTVLGMLVLGIPLERQLGFIKVGVIYVLSGFMGSLFSALMLHGRVSVGPSGAFMDLVGATLSSILTNWSTYRHRSQMLIGVIFFIALNTVYGLMPFIDNFMHIGGAVMGFLLGNLFFIRHHLLSLGTLIMATIMGMFALFSGMDMSDGCSWCRYLTCAPSHYWRCTSSRTLGCNPSSFKGGLRVTCANGRFFDYSTVQYAAKLTPEIEGLCIKACV